MDAPSAIAISHQPSAIQHDARASMRAAALKCRASAADNPYLRAPLHFHCPSDGHAEVLPIAKTRRVEVVRAQIDRGHTSLVAAMDDAGETIDLTLALADIFGGEVDFSTDVQPGDRVELAVEKQFREDGRFAGYGPILAADFVNAGRTLRAVRFTPEGSVRPAVTTSGRKIGRAHV